jgi:hypothetical protein
MSSCFKTEIVQYETSNQDPFTFNTELPFQQFGFAQPNRAVNYFPYVLLPDTIAPIVIWTHISDIIKLRKEI